jgi:hypothetical protein
MPAKPQVWWWAARTYWVASVGGKRVYLAKGRKNKQAAQQKLDALIAEPRPALLGRRTDQRRRNVRGVLV